jgi:hypothetical protein
MAFNFGTTTAGSASTAIPSFGGFGTTASTSTIPAFGALGTTAATQPAAGGFSFGGFGAPTAAPAAAAPAPAAGGFTGFGSFSTPTTTKPTTGFSLGGALAPAATTTTPAWGGFGPQVAVAGAAVEQWEGSHRIRNLQLSYAPYVDAMGNPVVALPATNLQQVADNEEKCEFDAIVYDRKVPGLAKPMKHKISQPRLEEAQRNNPDPEGSVPVRLLGIQELRNRFTEQSKESQSLSKNSDGIQSLINSLDTALQAQSLRFQNLKSKQIQLYNKLLSLMRKVEILRCYGCRLSRDEHG